MWTPLFFKLHKLDLATFDILGKPSHLSDPAMEPV
jgi:hypothetical protein